MTSTHHAATIAALSAVSARSDPVFYFALKMPNRSACAYRTKAKALWEEALRFEIAQLAVTKANKLCGFIRSKNLHLVISVFCGNKQIASRLRSVKFHQMLDRNGGSSILAQLSVAHPLIFCCQKGTGPNLFLGNEVTP